MFKRISATAWGVQMSIVAVVIGVLLFVLSIRNKPLRTDFRNDLRIEKARVDSLVGAVQREADMSKALQVLYGITEPEGAMLAREFKLAEADSTTWEIYAAVCRVESGFDPTLTSRAGCKGLMQLSDSTGARVARAAGIGWRRVAPWADALNVRVGCIYLRDLVAKFGEETAVKMYLAGEPNIKRKPAMPAAGEYMGRVMAERARLRYVYAGVRAERR